MPHKKSGQEVVLAGSVRKDRTAIQKLLDAKFKSLSFT